ncbi:346_t:CDS:1, partial [Racocetra persica]
TLKDHTLREISNICEISNITPIPDMTTAFLNDVSDDFKKLYETKEGHDAIIVAGQEPNVKEFQVHSLILRTRSSYFRCAFSANWAEKNEDGHLVLKKPNINVLVFEIIL